MSIVLSSLVFCLGAILQVINTHSIGAFYAGRVISGFGVGAATVLVPMFSAEMAPKHIRGQLGSFFQLFFALGVCVSYWYVPSPEVYWIIQLISSIGSTMEWRLTSSPALSNGKFQLGSNSSQAVSLVSACFLLRSPFDGW
jgi:MFS family permease